MAIEILISLAVAILTSIFGGVIYFIMQRVERLEEDHRTFIQDHHKDVDSVLTDAKEIGKAVKELDNKVEEKYVTKEYCRLQHRGE